MEKGTSSANLRSQNCNRRFENSAFIRFEVSHFKKEKSTSNIRTIAFTSSKVFCICPELIPHSHSLCPMQTFCFEFLALTKGTSLRNTDWVAALVLNTGPDCKVMMNRNVIRYKSTVLEEKLNRISLVIIAVQLLACFALSYQGGLFYKFNSVQSQSKQNLEDAFYIFQNFDQTPTQLGIIYFFSFFILLNTMIPISLMVSLEVVKYVQTLMIEADIHMNQTNDPKMKVQNTLTHEQLGVIDYVFTDKTGTLTSNEMVFRNCSIEGENFDFQTLKSNLDFHFSQYKLLEKSLSHEIMNSLRLMDSTNGLNKTSDVSKIKDNILERRSFHDFWLCLCLCTDVIVEKINFETNEFVYQGSSPDEVALVEAASKLSIVLLKKIPGFCQISYLGEILDFEVLKIIDFSSERKCMSVFVREMKSDVVVMFTKGADSVLMPKLSSQIDSNVVLAAKRHLKEYSKQGLRTLCLCKKVMSEISFNLWLKELDLTLLKSSTSAGNMFESNSSLKDDPLKGIHIQMESELQLVGVTAVEDKLQEKVSEVISNMHKAGIKVWMLTGDKLETAENIGYLCSLITKDTKVFRINSGLDLETILYCYLLSQKLLRIQTRIAEFALASSQNKNFKKRSVSVEDEETRSRKGSVVVSPNSGNLLYSNFALVIEGQAISEILSSHRASFIFLDLIPNFKFFHIIKNRRLLQMFPETKVRNRFLRETETEIDHFGDWGWRK